MKSAATLFAFGVGNALCSRCRVSLLTAQEAAAIGEAVAELAFVYGVAFDQKIDAWLGLGGALSAAAMPRIQEYRPAPEAPREELTPETRAPASAPPPPPTPPDRPALSADQVKDASSFTSGSP